MPSTRLIVSMIFLAALVGISGCGARSKGPAATLDQYRAALERKDFAAAYGMMSERFRSQHSREEFIRMMEENPGEVTDTVTALGRARQEVEIAAELDYGHGEQLRLVHEGEQWRIATNPIQFYSQATPRDALRSFVRAYRLGRWEIMLRFVPNRYRERMDADELRQQFQNEEVVLMMKTLETNIEEPITEQGNEARMPYSERSEVKLVREDGVWKILDMD